MEKRSTALTPCQDFDRNSPGFISPSLPPCGGDGESSEGAVSLPCLYSNNSIDEPHSKHEKEQILALCGILAPYQKRQAHALFSNVQRLIDLAPSPGHIGFFTLTTKDQTDKDEFSRRWNSFNSNFFSRSPHFGHWIGCFEQQKRGAWHLHVLVVMPYDIREGLNFAELEKRQYKTASPYLRSVWRDLRGACITYGFGRHELVPIKSNSEAMARYIGKYVSKHIGQREEAAKGKRLVTSSRGWLKNSSNFAWNTDGAKEWRKKVQLFAEFNGISPKLGLWGLHYKLGPNWAYNHLDAIYNIEELMRTDHPDLSINLQDRIESEAKEIDNGDLFDFRTGELLF